MPSAETTDRASEATGLPTDRTGLRRRRRVTRPRSYGLATVHPLAALAAVGALMVASIVIANPIAILLILVIMLLVIVLARRWHAARPYLRTGLLISAFLLVLSPLLSPAGLDVLWETHLAFWRISVSLQGLYFALGTALRMLAVITAFALYSTLLDQDEQFATMSALSFRSALVVSLATRMLPVLVGDVGRVSDAQRARGVELDRGGWRQRAARRLPLLGALIARSLERAMDVAESMEARGYGRRGRRTWRRRRRWRILDAAILAASLAAAGALITGLATGLAGFSYFPLTDDPLPGLGDPAWVATAVLLLLACIVLPAALDARRLVREHRCAATTREHSRGARLSSAAEC